MTSDSTCCNSSSSGAARLFRLIKNSCAVPVIIPAWSLLQLLQEGVLDAMAGTKLIISLLRLVDCVALD